MYSVRIKGHFEQDWKITHGHNGAVTWFVYQSDGKNTVTELATKHGLYELIYPEVAQIDVQVMALQGSYVREQIPEQPLIGEFFHGVTSDWSKTQTITVTYGSSSSFSQTTTAVPGNPTITSPTNYNPLTIDFNTQIFPSLITILIGIVTLLIGVIIVLTVFLVIKKTSKNLVAEQ